MGTFGIWQWVIVLAIVLLLFGRGKIPELMGDVAKGIRNFKKGMSDDTETAKDAVKDGMRTVEHKADDTVETVKDAARKNS